MEIRSLCDCSLTDLTLAFNAAFADYKIKLNLSEDAMATKIKAENIQLQYSVGAFDGAQLAGFILTATDTFNSEKVVYNAGTGVLPMYRGSSIAKQLYQYLIPQLQQDNYNKHQLEVFDDNDKAIAVYKNAGFKIKRDLVCYKGKFMPADMQHTVREILINNALFQSFWDVRPSWQNDLPSIQRNPEEHKVIGIEEKGELSAYAIYSPSTGRVKQWAVKHDKRQMGLGKELFKYMMQHVETKEIVVTCVEYNVAIDLFLNKIGLKSFLKMYEMNLNK